MFRRPRRNRQSLAIRSLVQETSLSPSDFIQPYFLTEQGRSPVASMPGIDRLPIDDLIEEATAAHKAGVQALLLFPFVAADKKDGAGSEILNPEGAVLRAIQRLKAELPSVCLIADVALDPYTTHGHDGLVDSNGTILNDETLPVLAQAAVLLGQAGADMIAPSDMMDGRVECIRTALDSASLTNVGILSYTAKYASAFYGPFREALNSAPQFGDKKTYQLDPANRREALLEAALDELEGADMLMVKPALAYLDIISDLRANTTLPIAAYQVSGEYSMIQAAAQNGWIDGDRVMRETLLSIKRAGADIIISYAAASLCKAGLH